ncbi:LysR substrate-binding domain-containing protein [Actibacterium lipolyticum]|uniref:Glycine cleavage system transcriptional activator n=1 Tax=Actibacterium lipolyticum TaxID=1524263 RepID=A0A238L9U1_9RHOB|nr:LysR substrate-binding domain-containing protein [Actibacterium lipolyticum]SMX51122.1 Glycine cleavage system transcriptional activator [Actibacterium lipolyticum]
MPRTPNLNAMPYFESVVRRGSISRAAEELSVSPSAVSQQIKLLEQQLGVKLFRRTGRVLTLTLEGELLAQTVGTALRMITDAQANLGRTRTARRLNLRVSPSFGVRWLGPRLSDFVAQYPDWDLRVDAAPDPTDFDREVMDLDVRYGTGNWKGLHTQPLVHDYVLPLASPDYLAGLPADDPLSTARLIDSARAITQWDYWLWHNNITTVANRKTILMDRSSMAIQLALDGAGVVLESLALASAELAEGRLVPVTPDIPVLRFPAYWALCPARFTKRRPVRLFLDWAEKQAATHETEVAALISKHGLCTTDITPETQTLHPPNQ